MDEDRLANQLTETGNIMDLCQDPAWLEETAQIERECGGYVEAGLLLREYAMSPQPVTLDQLQQVRLQSVLFAELHQWMSTWQLGLSFEKNLHPGPSDRATSSAKRDRRAIGLAAGPPERNRAETSLRASPGSSSND